MPTPASSATRRAIASTALPIGSLDASLDKSFAFGDKTKLQFRVESFNVTNHVNLIPPVMDMNSPAFGQITEAQAPRVLQFALKVQR